MSVDYMAHLAIGFVLTPKQIRKTFGKGAPKGTLRLGKQEFELNAEHELLEALADEVGGQLWIDGDLQYGDADDVTYVVGPAFKTGKSRDIDCRLSVGGDLPASELMDVMAKLETMRHQMKHLGIKVGKPVVRVAGTAS